MLSCSDSSAANQSELVSQSSSAWNDSIPRSSSNQNIQSSGAINHEDPRIQYDFSKVRQVSDRLHIALLGDISVIWDTLFQPDSGAGDWDSVVYSAEWNIYQNFYRRAYTVTLDTHVNSLVLSPREGDWLALDARFAGALATKKLGLGFVEFNWCFWHLRLRTR